MALYDLIGQRLGVPVYALLGLNPARTPRTSFTIAHRQSRRDGRARRSRRARVPILKIKLGTEHDLEIVRAIRGVTDATLRVDANAAWTPKQALRTIEALAAYDVEFVEQPVAQARPGGVALRARALAAADLSPTRAASRWPTSPGWRGGWMASTSS